MGYAIALLIKGLRDPQDETNTGLVYWVQGQLGDLTALGAPFDDASSRFYSQIPAAKGAISGFGWVSDPRKPIGEGTPITVSLEDPGDLLGALLAEDFAYATTDLWEIDPRLVNRGDTSIVVYGATAPTVGIYWIGPEAIYVSAASGNGDGLSYTLTIARAKCGSRERAHRIKPRTIPPGEDGRNSFLYLSSRPDWDHYSFEASLYQIETRGNKAISVVRARHGLITARPRPTGRGWKVTIEDATKRILNHAFGAGRPDVPLSHAIQVAGIEEASSPGGAAAYLGGLSILAPSLAAMGGGPSRGTQANLIDLWITGKEARFIFGEWFGFAGAADIDSTTAGEDLDRIAPLTTGELPWEARFVVKGGGFAGLYKVLDLDYSSDSYHAAGSSPTTEASYILARCQLLEIWEGSIASAPIITSPDPAIAQRAAGLNAGWSDLPHDSIRPGEEAPTITLWLYTELDFYQAFLYLALSDLGDGGNHATYDALPCGFGADIDPAWLEIGALGTAPSELDPGSLALLELATLDPWKGQYTIPIGGEWGNFGRWTENEALRALVLWASEPSTGAMGFRKMARPVATPSALVPAAGAGGIVAPGTRLEALESIKVEIGWVGGELAAADWRILRLPEAATADRVDKGQIAIRVWRRENIFSPEALASSPIPALTNFYFTQLRGAPSVFKVGTSILRGARKAGDLVSWTNPAIQTSQGRGVTALTCQVIALDPDWESGFEWLGLMPYALPLLSTQEGKVAPALRIIAYEEINEGTLYDCYVTCLGVVPFNIETSIDGIYDDLNLARVRVVSPSRHNPSGAGERQGWVEASAYISQIEHDGEKNRIRLLFNGGWTRGDVTIPDIIGGEGALILLSDRRKADLNPEGGEIVPPATQRPGGTLVAAVYAPPSPALPYDRNYYLFTE